MSNKKDYKLIQGETLLIYYVWYDSDGNANDLTDYTGSMWIYDRNDNLLEGIELTFSDLGEVEGSADSSLWPVGAYNHYVRTTSPEGEIVDLLVGKVNVE